MDVSRVNLIMGYLNSLVSAAISFIAIRLYISSLGIELFGVIAFYISTRTIIQILDLGMTQTICREVATHRARGRLNDVAALLFSMERIVMVIGFAVVALFWFGGSAFISLWFQGSPTSLQALKSCMTGMGIAIATRGAAGFYQGALVGTERLALSSLISIVVVVTADIGVITIWSLSTASLEIYFLWQAIVGALYVALVRWLSWREIGPCRTKTFSFQKIREIGGFSIDVAAISVAGLLLSQIDKIVVSKTLALADFAVYSLATMVAGTVYLITNPVFNYIFPRFSRLIVGENVEAIVEEYRAATRLLAQILFPTATIVVLVAVPIVTAWLGEPSISERVSPLVALLVFSYTIHSTMYIPYSLLLASGKTRSSLLLYLGLLVSVVPATVVLSQWLGTYGAAFSQILSFITYFIFGSVLTFRTALRGYKVKWLLIDNGPSLICSLTIGTLGFYVIQLMSLTLVPQLLVAFLVWALSYSTTMQFSKLMSLKDA